MLFHTCKREDYLYQSAYCEENIWHLCQHEALKNSYVVFIFSEGDSFPMLSQRAANTPSLPVFWDYHVVLLSLAEENQIFDFDTTLPFNTNVDTYFRHSFIVNSLLDKRERPMFRIIPSNEFISLFSSDRSHMKKPSGAWYAPPPTWPLIGRSKMNLFEFTNPKNTNIGELLSAESVLERFS